VSGAIVGRGFLEADWSRVRRLLVELEPVTPLGFVWEVRRWDGWRWYVADPAWDPGHAATARIWETSAGTLVAVAHREDPGTLHLQVGPGDRQLEPELFAWGEAELAVPHDRGRHLGTEILDGDESRQELAQRRGWQRTERWSVVRRRRLGPGPLAAPRLAPGYALRTLRFGDPEDHGRLATLLNAAFGRTTHHAAETLTFERREPGYRADLQLVAVAGDGTFAAHVGLTLEPTSGLVIVEPVCTAPAHRRHGLAEALIRIGLERARLAGASHACVGTGDEAGPNRLYVATGFDEASYAHRWEWHS
jgi:predicted N-acetyltransferase YhbS